ncbi:hypothetical protein SNE40_011279 [Patella caerulea]|uniref:Transmembrane protein n=1 Tax=Patella caerulea TaxID=87958 RepID=A0AAN8PP52_PATCE
MFDPEFSIMFDPEFSIMFDPEFSIMFDPEFSSKLELSKWAGLLWLLVMFCCLPFLFILLSCDLLAIGGISKDEPMLLNLALASFRIIFPRENGSKGR